MQHNKVLLCTMTNYKSSGSYKSIHNITIKTIHSIKLM